MISLFILTGYIIQTIVYNAGNIKMYIKKAAV